MTQYGLYIDQSRCMGCFACVVACKDWHDVPAGPASRISVITIEKGKYPDLFVAFLPTACYHCKMPACVDACPVGAIAKRDEDGIVTVDRDLCLGKKDCGQCLEACSYGAPQFENEDDAKMQKCDLCLERTEKGLKPACVGACPQRALDAGPMEELAQRYGGQQTVQGGFADPSLTKPNILFKPRIFVGS